MASKASTARRRPRYEEISVTGNPWLDGALYARGSRRSQHCIQLRVGHTPHALLPDLETEMERAGFRVLYQLIPHAVTRREELYLIGESSDIPCGPMGAFQHRRLPVQAPPEFMLGFFFMACEPRIQVEIGPESPPSVTHLAVAPWSADEDLETVQLVLAAWGISATTRRRRSICILPEDAAHTPPFDRILEAARRETEWAHRTARPPAAHELAPAPQDTRLQPLLSTLYNRRVAAARIMREVPLFYARRKPERRFCAVSPATLEETRKDCAALACAPNGAPMEDAMERLSQRYDHVLQTFFAKSWDYKTLIQFAHEPLAQKRDRRLDGSERRELRRRRKRLEGIFDDRLREKLLAMGKLPLAVGETPTRPMAQLFLECAQEVYARQGGFHFAAAAPALPDRLLRECGGCGGAALLSFGGHCDSCGAPLCETCEGGNRLPAKARNGSKRELFCLRHSVEAAPTRPLNERPGTAIEALPSHVELAHADHTSLPGPAYSTLGDGSK